METSIGIVVAFVVLFGACFAVACLALLSLTLTGGVVVAFDALDSVASAMQNRKARKRQGQEKARSDAHTLLHASSIPEPSAENLLRAAQGTSEADPQTLLRPAEKENVPH